MGTKLSAQKLLMIIVTLLVQYGSPSAQIGSSGIADSTISAARSANEAVSPAAGMFEKKCYSCHNIGQGDKKGPDLKNVSQRRTREWLVKFVQSPTSMKNGGNAAAAELFARYSPETMPDQDISEEQISGLLAFIEELSQRNQVFIPSGARLSREPTPEDIPAGRRHFTGALPFESGAPYCMSCHTISGVGLLGGGTLGPDLTKLMTRYTVPEVVNILQNPNFPMMSRVVGSEQFTEEEIVHLVGFFQEASTREPDMESDSMTLIYTGIALSIILLVIANRIWANRFTGVRIMLVQKKQSECQERNKSRFISNSVFGQS